MQIQFVDVAEIFPMGLFADLGAAPKVEPEIPDNERERVMAERDALSDMLNDAIEIIERERAEASQQLVDISLQVAAERWEQIGEVQRLSRGLEQYRRVFQAFNAQADSAGIEAKPGVARMTLVLDELAKVRQRADRQGEEIGSLQARVNEYADRINKAESEVIATGQVLRHMVRDRLGALESAKGRLDALRNAGFHF